MPHYDSPNSSLSMEFIANCTLISSVCEKLKQEKYEIIILGDFNVDFVKTLNKPSHAKLLVDTMTNLGMMPIDVFSQQAVSYTHVSSNYGVTLFKWLDRIWIHNMNKASVNVVRITDFRGNLSDHLPILCHYEFSPKINF